MAALARQLTTILAYSTLEFWEKQQLSMISPRSTTSNFIVWKLSTTIFEPNSKIESPNRSSWVHSKAFNKPRGSPQTKTARPKQNRALGLFLNPSYGVECLVSIGLSLWAKVRTSIIRLSLCECFSNVWKVYEVWLGFNWVEGW